MNESKGGRKGSSSPKKKTTPATSPTKAKVETPEEVKDVKVLDTPPAESPVIEELPTTTTENKGVENDTGEGDEGGASWSGWFANTITSAKEKSSEMFQYLKQDLSEFTETVSEAGRDLKDKAMEHVPNIEEGAFKAVEIIGEKVNVALEQMSTIFGVGPDDEDEKLVVGGNVGSVMTDRIQAKIYSLALDESVFLDDPKDMEKYEKWLTTFDLETKEDQIAELMTANPHLQLHYSNFVPDKVPKVVFWHRFFYRVQLIFDEEDLHIMLEKVGRSQKNHPKSSVNNPDYDPPKDDLGAGGDQQVADISEEDQKRLLAEYEEELKKSDESGKHSRRSSEGGNQMSSSSSGSFAFVTRDPETNEINVE